MDAGSKGLLQIAALAAGRDEARDLFPGFSFPGPDEARRTKFP